MVAIYRGGQAAAGYEQLLRRINAYLINSGLYTQKILPGMAVEGAMLEYINPPFVKRTASPAEDNRIAEVERLPYFIDYENDDGESETMRSKGSIIVMRCGA